MINIFWFRRDLRIEDNTALVKALEEKNPILCLFIFDTEIIDNLPNEDSRITFIHQSLETLNETLKEKKSSLLIKKGKPQDVWNELINEYEIEKVFTNKDYEPYARRRDGLVKDLLQEKGIKLERFKDQVIFEENDIIKEDGKPYTVYTPYKNKWLATFKKEDFKPKNIPSKANFVQKDLPFPAIKELGFKKSEIKVPQFDLENLSSYGETRNFPSKNSTSHLGPYLRFGTISIRNLINSLGSEESVFLSELIWREFFMQILYHFPKVVDNNFRAKYDGIQWRNNEDEFKKWCTGQTGYAIVDAGMRELNTTGFMHNRVRMVVASFLCKHLLIDWRWGEAYFAEKLLDYELSSNNGNWQWAAGTGCDAAPYFRVFNPYTQQEKFDKNMEYTKKWVPEYGSEKYVKPMVDHKMARERALGTYKNGLEG